VCVCVAFRRTAPGYQREGTLGLGSNAGGDSCQQSCIRTQLSAVLHWVLADVGAASDFSWQQSCTMILLAAELHCKLLADGLYFVQMVRVVADLH